jgi:hypothetical protein
MRPELRSRLVLSLIASAEVMPFIIVLWIGNASSFQCTPAKDLKPGTLRGIIADMGLTPEDFIALL